MTNEEYLASVADLNVVGDVVAFKAPTILMNEIAKIVYRIGTIVSYSPRGELPGSKVVKTRSGTEYTIGDDDGSKWTFPQWDKGQLPAIRIDGQETPASIKPSFQVLVLPD